jgi:hypothetical protein
LRKTLIILILVLNWSCSTNRFLSEKQANSVENSIEKIIADTRKNNISGEGYFIEKAEIFITENNSTVKYLFTGKFEKPDKYLFSIRTIAGFEGARIFITGDTIIINDRIKKRLLFGKPEKLEKLTGLSFFFVNVAFGDLILNGENVTNNTESRDNELILIQEYQEKLFKAIIDLKIKKVRSVAFFTGSQNEELSLKYSKYSKDPKHFPMLIEIRDYKRDLQARIRIKRLQVPWNGKVDFISGSGYTKEEIK